MGSFRLPAVKPQGDQVKTDSDALMERLEKWGGGGMRRF